MHTQSTEARERFWNAPDLGISPETGRQVEPSESRPESNLEQLRFRSRCGFEILGATTSDSTKEELPDGGGFGTWTSQERMMHTLVSALEPDQKVSFIYEGGGNRPLQWKICGEAVSTESRKDADARLINVENALRTILESRKSSYRYRPIDRETLSDDKTNPHTFRRTLCPQGSWIQGRGSIIGFEANADDQSSVPPSVCLPHYIQSRARAFRSLISLLSSSQTPLQISIALSTCRLTHDQEHALKSIMDVILDRRASRSIAEHVEKAANIWLTCMTGCRITCSVSSDKAIPDAFLRMLGAEIYHGPVEILAHHAAASPKETNPPVFPTPAPSLDLRDCIPSAVSVPPLFPEPDSLLQHGMKRFFNRDTPAQSHDGCLMGSVGDGMTEQDVHLDHKTRNQHLYILGATGTGKSTLLFNMVMQDIQAGKGVCLVDPHGDLYAQVLKAMPPERADDVVLLDPQDRKRAVGMNLLECTGPHREAQINLVINELLAMLNKLYDMQHCGGPMFELYFRNALQLVMSVERAPGTLMDVGAVFEHKSFRDKLLKYADNPLLQDFWNMAESVNGDHRLGNIAPYIVSKLNSFVNNALLRPIIGQPQTTLNIRQIMDRRQILLVNLSRGALGELDMRLLGMIILTKIICAAMERMDIAPSRRKPFMVYVDEFQNFTSDATASLLSESRKFGLCLTLANQNLSQLMTGQGNENVIHSVLGNVGSMALFRLGVPDAARLAMYTKPQFGAQDLQDLPNYHAAARLLTPQGPTPAFVFQTNPATKCKSDTATQRRIRQNQRTYTADIKQVEKMLQQRREFIRNIKSPEDTIIENLFG